MSYLRIIAVNIAVADTHIGTW